MGIESIIESLRPHLEVGAKLIREKGLWIIGIMVFIILYAILVIK